VTLPRGASRVRAAFAGADAAGRTALIAYLVAGHPDDQTSLAAATAALDGGADVLEIGIPFSDPVADGPVIAAAGQAAVAAGGGLASAGRLIAALRAAGRKEPLLAMGYMNPLVAQGARTALDDLASAGADALIIPDLPAGEDTQLERLVAHAGLGICFLVSPNTLPPRVERAIRASTAFLYVVPLFGVTGARDQVATTALPFLRRIRTVTDGRVPVAVGFGVSRPEHVRELGAAADGVIVGSAVVAALEEGGPARVRDLVALLANATSRPRRAPDRRRRSLGAHERQSRQRP